MSCWVPGGTLQPWGDRNDQWGVPREVLSQKGLHAVGHHSAVCRDPVPCTERGESRLPLSCLDPEVSEELKGRLPEWQFGHREPPVAPARLSHCVSVTPQTSNPLRSQHGLPTSNSQPCELGPMEVSRAREGSVRYGTRGVIWGQGIHVSLGWVLCSQRGGRGQGCAWGQATLWGHGDLMGTRGTIWGWG